MIVIALPQVIPRPFFHLKILLPVAVDLNVVSPWVAMVDNPLVPGDGLPLLVFRPVVTTRMSMMVHHANPTAYTAVLTTLIPLKVNPHVRIFPLTRPPNVRAPAPMPATLASTLLIRSMPQTPTVSKASKICNAR
jgi:hypothetical protein